MKIKTSVLFSKRGFGRGLFKFTTNRASWVVMMDQMEEEEKKEKQKNNQYKLKNVIAIPNWPNSQTILLWSVFGMSIFANFPGQPEFHIISEFYV